jgi:PAS domain S-box-containing protein
LGLTITLTVLGAWVAVLFAIAFWGDAKADRLDRAPVRRAWLYVLGLGVYCTSWTFYGAVGDASRNGWDYLPIYLGPALVFLIGFSVVKRLVRLGREHNTGSIADFLSARYGKSAGVGALAAGGLLLAVIPYIALQLKSASSTVSMMVQGEAGGLLYSVAVALAFAAFAIVFGQRRADAAAGNRGLVLAIAVESFVKLLAMAGVGIFAVIVWQQTPADIRAEVLRTTPLLEGGFDLRFLVITALAGLAALTLPRQFHMMVVETRAPDDARFARLGFPAYLAVVALVAPPVSLAGSAILSGSDPDAFVLALPLALGAEGLALLAFIGGFSAAAGMVTISALAMSTMLVNDLAAPLVLRSRERTGALPAADGLASRLLTWRRLAVIGLVGAALAFQLGMDRSVGLAGIGLVAFAGAAQLAPALLFGLYWRKANRAGAVAGMGTGLVLWIVLILIPTYAGFEPPAPGGLDGFAFASAISLIANAIVFVMAVAFSSSGLIDQTQADAFTGLGRSAAPRAQGARMADLTDVLVRVLGQAEADAALEDLSLSVGRPLKPGETPTPAIIDLAEARLARSLGAASARILITRVVAGARVSSSDVVTLIDETAEKLRTSHDRLQESERSIRFYTDNLPALLSYADQDYRLRFANKGYLDFFEIDESAIGRPLSDFMTGDEYALRRPHMEAALNGDRQVFDITRRKGKGRRRSWQVVYQPRIEDGQVVGFFGVYQDNTARREAEEGLKRAYDQLERRVDERTAELRAESEARGQLARDLDRARADAEAATRSKTRFLAAASHDLLQPLSAARLFAGVLEEALKDDETLLKTAARIEKSIDQADRLLRALLDISRLDAGGVTPSLSVFSLDELMESTAAQFTAKADAKGLRLKVRPCRMAVLSDRGLMTSVLQNLISNAVRYTQSGAILVGARRAGKEVRLQVIDTGPGIPVARQNDIFREFDRGGRQNESDRGLGLGLAVTDRICRTLGHRLTLISDAGQGACFEVRLPRASSKAPTRRSPRRTRSSDLTGLKVLCVEDEREVRDGLTALMTGWGCDARGAETGAEARLAFKAGVPDVVVVDFHLQDGETGPSVYKTLCELWSVEPPGLLITAERGPDISDLAAASGLELLQKPVPPAVLRASLSALKRKLAAS